MKYKLESRRYRGDWEVVEYSYPRDPSDLKAWIEIGKDQDSYDGQYEYRIVDETNVVMWTMIPPADVGSINLLEPAEDWMRMIQNGYGLDDTTFEAACRAWISKFGSENS